MYPPVTFQTIVHHHRYRCLFLAFVFAAILASLPVDMFIDRDNYILYAIDAVNVFKSNLSQGWLRSLTNEPVWLGINILLGNLADPKGVLRIIIFISSFVVAYLTLQTEPRALIILVLFLLLPQILKNHVIHLRQGVAVAVFLLAWFGASKSTRVVLLCLTPLIHASFFFVIFLYALNCFFVRFNFSAGLRLLTYLIVSLLLAGTSLWLASQLGARQGDQYQSAALEISGLGFVFWLGFFTLFILQGPTFLRANSFPAGLLLFYLVSYFALPIGARIFESGLILIMLAALQLTGWRKQAFYLMFAFYFCMQWLPRLFLPGFGWAV